MGKGSRRKKASLGELRPGQSRGKEKDSSDGSTKKFLQQLFTEPHLISALWCLAAIVSFWAFGYCRMEVSDLWWHLAKALGY